MLRRKPLRLTFAILAVELFAVACQPTTVAPTGTPQASFPRAEIASPGLAQPGSSPTAAAGLVGRITAAINCGSIVDDSHRRWEIKWANGSNWGFGNGAYLVVSASGKVLARQGDRIGLNGYQGWYAEGKVLAKLDLAVIDPQGPAMDLDSRRALVRRWAKDQGIEVSPSYMNGRGTGWWVFRVSAGAEDAVIDELSGLPEVLEVAKDAEGSFCSVGWPFTATSIAFVEPGWTEEPIPSP